MTLSEMQVAAEKAMQEQHWSQAASLWETVYQAQQTPEINYQLVQSLVADEKYAAASTYASEFETYYLQTDEAATLYLTALLNNQQFIQARILVHARPGSWQKMALVAIQAAEEKAERTLQSTLTTTMRQFYHLSDQPVVNHASLLQAATHLTYSKYLTAAKFLLVDPFLHPLTRVEVLYTLREIGVTDTVKVQWIDELPLTVTPADLPMIGQDSASLAVQDILQDRLGQQDVTLFASLQELLALQLMYLYPQTETVVSDPQRWVDILIAMQTGTLSENPSQTDAKIIALQQKLQQFTLDFQK
ncbi:hypothetical protein [Lactiplantibacillus herbarum]|uniref:hypothetical protein n=1 Tax=Lactiplantibacillus herbarum TaxID=1670446 RepID=UPI00064FDB12|nr:hypothetical protein [Lactiplantibacillus herbarum]